ncbi:PQQ-like beta-propeller repeat protein (plasmid) [Embleya sp. NBC_00888]|uniref:outer membrane protein assembly factor BamB family protein n=1 Tax=Embleya sp. NBC_00888 TaxID=2975960 RepID=UPI002F91289A|nr:PQQ-like beta-propeller repeat protein [Embleya sp. NBC_00888]
MVRAFDPPKAFAGSGVVLPTVSKAASGAVVLHNTTAYVTTTSGIQALDTVTGRPLATIAPAGAPSAGAGPDGLMQGLVSAGPAVLVRVGGRELVVAPFVVMVPGRGTTAGRLDLSLTAVDPADNTAAWTVSAPLPAGAAAAAVIGTHGDRVLVTVARDSIGSVYAVDTVTRAVVWSKDGFLGATVTGDSVVAVEPRDGSNTMQTVTALNVADGSRRWSLPNNRYESTITYAGPKLVAVEGRDYSSGRASFQLIDGDTGADAMAPSTATGWSGTYAMKCLYDRRAVTVCSGVGIVMGLDATTGKELWRLPDRAAGRVAPSVTAAWHGVVYATADGPVVLDAATGRDLATPNISPVAVSATTGIVVDPSGSVRAHPATG